MLVHQPFTPLLWACIIATVFLMALVFWLYSHLSVRGAYPVRSARQGKRYCPGLPVVLDMAARMPPAHSVILEVHKCCNGRCSMWVLFKSAHSYGVIAHEPVSCSGGFRGASLCACGLSTDERAHRGGGEEHPV